MSSVLCAVGAVLVTGCAWGVIALTEAPHVTAATSRSEPVRVTGNHFGYRLVPGRSAEGIDFSRGDTRIRLLDHGTTSRIVDGDGRILNDGRTGAAIYGLHLSPHRTSALVYFGDATYTIAPVERLENATPLPVQPAEFDDATGFTWRWLDDVHLLGESHLPSMEIDGKTASEIDALPPRAVLLYVYSVASGEMAHVEVGDGIPKRFTVHEVSGWNLRLLTLGAHAESTFEATLEPAPAN